MRSGDRGRLRLVRLRPRRCHPLLEDVAVVVQKVGQLAALVPDALEGIELDGDGLPLPYAHWHYELKAAEESWRIFPTGVGGVLYPPGIFHPDVLDRGLQGALCPTADDLWLYWMARRNGATFRKVGRYWTSLWPGSQAASLHHINVMQGGNDRQIANLIARFGFPAG